MRMRFLTDADADAADQEIFLYAKRRKNNLSESRLLS